MLQMKMIMRTLFALLASTALVAGGCSYSDQTVRSTRDLSAQGTTLPAQPTPSSAPAVAAANTQTTAVPARPRVRTEEPPPMDSLELASPDDRAVTILTQSAHDEWALLRANAIEALMEFEKKSPRQAEVVWLRFVIGLNISQTARVLGISDRTVIDDWKFARASLLANLAGK